MKIKSSILLTALLSVLFFYSCSKEKSIDSTDPNAPGNNNSSSSLSKVVYKSGSDSSVATFAYDDSKRIKTINTVLTDAGSAYKYDLELTRNSQGITQKFITKSDALAQYGITEITTNVAYDAGSKQYKNRVTTINILGQTIKDSTVYEYDGSGKIARERNFFKQGPAAYIEDVKTEYTYSGNNLKEIKMYSFNPASNGYDNDFNQSFEYDQKVSPLILGNEAFVINEPSFFSANNVIKQIDSDPTDPSSNETTSTTYTYNSGNKPLTGTLVKQPNGGNATVTYTY